MLNQLVVLVNLIGLFLIDTFLLADISITQNIPATMQPGSEVRVTVTVNKGDLGGFAKLQIDLPPGMTVTAIDTKGASFTFADQKAKFIWMALPASPTFKITYTLSSTRQANGLLPITGRLSYIENNERKTFELPEVKVDLGAPGMIAATTPTTPDQANNDMVSAAGGAIPKGAHIAVIDNVSGVAPIQGVGGVSGSRTITPLSSSEMQVEVTVRKGEIRGFGKLQENIPAGFTAIEGSSEDAIFTAQDRIVKFVWLSLPVKNEIKVVYRLRANDKDAQGEHKIDGEFGYLVNDETQRAVVGTSLFFIGQRALDAIAEDTQKLDAQEQEDPKMVMPAKPDPIVVKPVEPVQPPKEKEQPVAKQPKPKPVVKEETVTASTPSTISGPEKGILYKVQITAAHREVGKPYFAARHNYRGDFSIERHQGWIKYVTGRFGTYQDARDQRQTFVQAGHKFPGPFVTAYNNGERITVQEALLISNQKWVQ
ncbi:MAG: hypothetical protein M3R08_00330 [Bacteroidota bacterium]|nr:hypothetical protein [Bacteroidota bacterium]